MSILPRVMKPAIFGALILTSLPGWAEPELELTSVINTAIGNDPWLRQSTLMQEASLEESVAEGAFPDPRLTIGAANLPTDTFDTGQEPITQANIGFTYLWLEIWRTQQSIRLIEDNRGLFEQLTDVAEAGYTSAAMGSRQQDIIRASLEVTRLEDRLTALSSQLSSGREALAEWVSAVDPGASMSAIDNDELKQVAGKIRDMLSEAIHTI